MSSFARKAFVCIALASSIVSNIAAAQALKIPILVKPPIFKTPITCLSCPDLSKLPKFEEGLTAEDKREVLGLMDDAFHNLKDLPETPTEVLTSVDFWERLNIKEKESILDHRFGETMNAAVAAVVVAAAALAWDVYKDYRQTKWNPADMGFDRIRTLGSLDYIKNSAIRLDAVRSIQFRLNAFQGLNQIGQGLNY